jgi:hypothetical protein
MAPGKTMALLLDCEATLMRAVYLIVYLIGIGQTAVSKNGGVRGRYLGMVPK